MGKLAIIKNDPWLEPYSAAIEGRQSTANGFTARTNDFRLVTVIL